MLASSLTRLRRLWPGVLLAGLALGCSPATETASPASPPPLTVVDPQSYARPDQVAVRHLDLVAAVDFDLQRITATASYQLDRRTDADHLILDTRGLDIDSVTLDDGVETTFELGEEHRRLGQALSIALRPETETVHVAYSTRPDALALQWLRPEQTAGGKEPYLFTQSQPIFARTWIPIQDTPQVRLTYDATIQVPPHLLALMSASNPQEKTADGVYHFDMPQPIPSYLLALAVGDIVFKPLSERTGVYAEPSVVEAAAWELADTEAMVEGAEELYGPYRWERYDLLVLPPSFPFGGMENPRLTFATPTILAGDRSLVTLVAHELAHSWSGNLVTNATWNDIWLNEGFTV
ncbi:MAG: aminopeptidase, partial [Acidobacteria bacterium]|nr:aminopeptidase [Acidobacteriota bacterium]